MNARTLEKGDIKNYGNFLRKEFEDETLAVETQRRFDVGLTVCAVQITLNKSLYLFFRNMGRNNGAIPQVRLHLNKEEEFKIHCPNTHMADYMIKLALLNHKLIKLDHAISADTKNAFKELIRLLYVEAEKPVNAIVLNHYLKNINELLINPNPSIKQIEKSAQNLDEALVGKPPLSASMSAAIYTVISTLVAAAIGAAVIATVAAITGGFAAVPAALLTGIKTCTTAEAIGISACGISTGIYGFFSGRAQTKAYQHYRQIVISNEIKETTAEINNTLRP